MDIPNPNPRSSTILVVEPEIGLADDILRSLTDAGHTTCWLPPGSNTDALDLIATMDFDGLYCAVELSGSFEDWEIGTTFNFYGPDCPIVYATSSGNAPPCLRRRDLFLRKPFEMDRLLQALAPDGRRYQREYRMDQADIPHARPSFGPA